MIRRASITTAFVGALAAVIALALGFARPSLADESTPAKPAATSPLLDRIAFIGASVTDGFMLPGQVGAMITLADTFEAAVKRPIEPFRKSGWVFFNAPKKYAERYVEATLARKPTLVVAADFMFWFGYGYGLTEPQRLERFEQGVELLSRFECPLVVGDYPDMSQAVHGVGFLGFPMIGPLHVPQPETLKELNSRLRAWAAKRGNVSILPLGDFIARIRKNETIDVFDNRWSGNVMKTLLDKDLLHTTLDGEIALTLLIIDTMLRSDLGFAREEFVLDALAVKKRLLEVHAAEISQRARHHR